MKKSWVVAIIAICIVGLIAYSEVRTMQLAEQQAEFQKQQLKLAEQAAERQKQLDDQAKLDKKLADIKSNYETQRYLVDVQSQIKLDQLKSDRQRRNIEELERKAGVPWAKPAN